MATVNKDFKVKYGLIVEGSTATVGGHDVITDAIVDAKGDILVASGADAIARLGIGTNGQVLTAASGATYGIEWANPAAVGVFGSSILFEGATANDFETTLEVTDPTADRTITLPDATGTVALTSDITTHANLTEAHGATGAVVGTTNTQTLTNKTLTSPVINTPTGITKSDVGLGSVDNTTDADKPVSTATQTALDLKAPLASPALTGTPTAPTATAGTNTTQVATTAFVGTAVANLVDGAPALLDTLNELAQALSDNPDTITNLATSVGLKAPIASPTFTGTVTIPAGASISGFAPLASPDLTGVPTAPTAAADTNTTQVATTAFAKAEADAAQTAAIAYADALTTSDVAEGTSEYFTDARAKSSAASLLTGATLSNITITGTGAGLTITAEDGIAGKTTTDLSEGTNLYFTNARAVTALEAVVPKFTAVEINSLAKQVAATLSVPTASAANVAYAFPKATYRSAEFLVKTAYGDHTEVSKVLLTLDTSDNIAVTEYGTIGTNGASMTISAGISGANVQLLVTTANNSSTVSVVGTLLA